MVRYYLSPMLDDGIAAIDGGLGIHAKVEDYLSYELGRSVACAIHPDGWALVRVNGTDHSELDAAPDIDDLFEGGIDTANTKTEVLNKLVLPISAPQAATIKGRLNSKGINTDNVSTYLDVFEAVLIAINPNAKIGNLGGG